MDFFSAWAYIFKLLFCRQCNSAFGDNNLAPEDNFALTLSLYTFSMDKTGRLMTMEKEATAMIEKDSSNIISGIIVGSSIGIAIYAIAIAAIYYFLL